MAQVNNFAPYKGERIVINFTMTPLTDISGWAMQFTLKRKATDAAAVLTQAAVITSAAQGQFSVSLTKVQTNLPAGEYAYDVQRIDAGSEAVLSVGLFTIQQEVLN